MEWSCSDTAVWRFQGDTFILPALNHTPQLTPEVQIPFIRCHHNTFYFLQSEINDKHKTYWKRFMHYKMLKGFLTTQVVNEFTQMKFTQVLSLLRIIISYKSCVYKRVWVDANKLRKWQIWMLQHRKWSYNHQGLSSKIHLKETLIPH